MLFQTQLKRTILFLISIVTIFFFAPPIFAQNDLPQFSHSSIEWTKWNRDPIHIFKGQYGIVGDPSIIKMNNQYVMYYGCFDPMRKPQGTDICLATSHDGFDWILPNIGNMSVLGQVMTPNKNNWHTANETPYALIFMGKIFLYFTGYKDQGGIVKSAPASLGIATTKNGLNFISNESPIILTDPNGYDQSGIVSPTIVEDQRKLYMIYAGHCYTLACKPRIGSALMMAESTDGMKWIKKPGLLLNENTVLPSFVKSLHQMAEPEIIKGPDNKFYLFFTALDGDNPMMIGVARSESIKGPWIFNPNPIITVQGREKEVVAPHVIIENNKARMWFSVFEGSGINIHYAESPWPIYIDSVPNQIFRSILSP